MQSEAFLANCWNYRGDINYNYNIYDQNYQTWKHTAMMKECSVCFSTSTKSCKRCQQIANNQKANRLSCRRI